MISDAALNICLSLTTIELMAETLIAMNRYGTTLARLIITLLILALGGAGFGYHMSEWLSTNLGG